MTELPTLTFTDTPIRTELSGRPGLQDPESHREYENFKDLAGKLLQVPKSEIEE